MARRAAEAGTALALRPAQLARRRRVAARYLAEARPRKLQIGAGSLALPGWLNTDLSPTDGATYLDATRRFPFADATFDYVLSEHQIEHLHYEDALFMLREAHRVLRPGGRVRIATPDLERLLSLLHDRDSDVARRYVSEIVTRFVPSADAPRPGFAVNNVLYGHGHRFLYDEEMLAATLERAGFVEPRRYAPGESDDAELRGTEGHGGGENPELNAFDTLVVEARRPSS